jgi:hypothetical protein
MKVIFLDIAIPKKNITLVGVHVRRGDKLLYKDVNVASQEYLHNAVTYFRKKYGKVLFIVNNICLISPDRDMNELKLQRPINIY